MSPTETASERIDREAAEWAAKQNGHGPSREDVVRETARLIEIEDEAAARAAKGRSESRAPLKRRKADIRRARQVEWAWQDRVLLGYLTLLIGEEGIGKGTLVPWLFARLTRGKLRGDLHGEPVTVAVIADEDDFDTVWTPRLYAAKADLRRVELWEPPDDGYITLGGDKDRIRDAVDDSGARVLYLDSLVDNLGVEVNDHHPKQLRAALRPAKTLAKDADIAVIGTLHTNKAGESARDITPGAHQYGAVARGSIFLFHDLDEPERTLLVHGKSNHAKRPHALTFAIDEYQFRNKHGEQLTGPLAVDMRDGGELSADEAIAQIAAKRKSERNPSKAARLEDLLRELLPHDGQWHLASPIVAKCEADGYDARSVTRARDKLGIYHRRRPGSVPAPTEWSWLLPTTDTTTDTRIGVRTDRSSRSSKTPAKATTATTDTTDIPTRVRSGRRSGKGAKRKAER